MYIFLMFHYINVFSMIYKYNILNSFSYSFSCTSENKLSLGIIMKSVLSAFCKNNKCHYELLDFICCF